MQNEDFSYDTDYGEPDYVPKPEPISEKDNPIAGSHILIIGVAILLLAVVMSVALSLSASIKGYGLITQTVDLSNYKNYFSVDTVEFYTANPNMFGNIPFKTVNFEIRNKSYNGITLNIDYTVTTDENIQNGNAVIHLAGRETKHLSVNLDVDDKINGTIDTANLTITNISGRFGE